MSANKAALLNSATERAILEHDKALKGLKVKQIIASEAIDWRIYDANVEDDYTIVSITLDPGEIFFSTFGGIQGSDKKLGIILPFWNFNIDVDNDPSYRWHNGANIFSSGRRLLTYGWKYDQNDFNGIYDGEDNLGKIPINFWIKNEDVSAHTYFIKYLFATSFDVGTFSA